MKLAIVIGTKERGSRLLDQIVQGPMAYSEAVNFIKRGDHRDTQWEKLAVSIVDPVRKFNVSSLNEARSAEEAAKAKDATEKKVTTSKPSKKNAS